MLVENGKSIGFRCVESGRADGDQYRDEDGLRYIPGQIET
jgi:hypothetical protein